jgi:hypothetical protein
MSGFGQNLACTGKLGRRRFAISIFASEGQPFLSSCLTAIFPVFPLALLEGALVIAESLARALYFEESPAMRIGANADVAKV